MNYTADVKKDFGAKGDGIADDFAALQAALDSLKTTGGTIYFPSGTYLISECLVFYSNQTLDFEDGAILKRKALYRTFDPEELRYLLASYTENNDDYTDYKGTHDVVIRGCIFDANSRLKKGNKITMLNTCHCRNITVTGCTFLHCAEWHCIEFNATADSVIENCVFYGNTYTSHGRKTELVQLDAAIFGNYGPVFYPDGSEMEFYSDEKECENITIRNNKFICDSFAAIGCHADYPHHGVDIYGNEFVGNPGYRGYITFMSRSYDINIHDNTFDELYADAVTLTPDE